MAEIDINGVAEIGSIRDVKPYMLPPEAWNLALNMRPSDGRMENMLGWASIFGTPTVAPEFLLPLTSAIQNFWLYVSLTKAYVWDGSVHTNITRQSVGVDVNYSAAAGQDWNGTLLGGIPILNNGSDVPQFWSPQTIATKLQNLTNWPSTLRAKIVRSFGPFLVAYNCTKSGTAFPHLVKWSHPADPGTVPGSWDETDTTKDTGETDLTDTAAGVIVDALPLGDTMFIYKQNSIRRQTFIGGRDIFDFGQSPWLPTIGLISPRAVCAISDGARHVWASQDDIMWHNGNSYDSILTHRQRVRLQNEIDASAFNTCFMFDKPLLKEVWFCYPGSGQSFPDRALVMNYSDKDKWVITEADGITFRHAASGPIESPSNETWADNPSETWDQDTGPWSLLTRRRTLAASTANTKIYNLDSAGTRDGSTFSTTLQRTGLSLLGRTRQGQWIVDHQVEKLLKRMWPKGTGGPFNVRVGFQQVVDGPVSWSDISSFDPSTDITADMLPVNGRAVAVEFSCSSGASWGLDGYKIDIDPVGNFGGVHS
jgi:hypothetical protein